MTVYVSVAVYLPGGTSGSGDVKLTFVGHASPPVPLGDDVVPIRRSAAGAIGMAAFAPPASCAPIVPPLGAEAVMPRGRSAGWKAERCTVSAYPAAFVFETVTRSETAAGESPAIAFPKLMFWRSSVIESTDEMSMSTPALADAESPGGGGVPEQDPAVVAELRGAGVAPAKSLEFVSVSVQPSPARRAPVVLLRPVAAPEPSKSVAEP
jgi:hypothetical protein